jgi:hypothetical protein
MAEQTVGGEMKGKSRAKLLRFEMIVLYQRARRAIEESRKLAADRDFIISWYGMRSGTGRRGEEKLLDDA